MSLLPPSSSRRIAELDVLRGIAILAVLLVHAPWHCHGEWFTESILWRHLFQRGWIGVDLFFVLSGYLVSGLLFKEYKRSGEMNIRRFWWRRGLKIWPAYYCFFGALILIQVFAPCLSGEDARLWMIRKSWANWVFLQNYFDYKPWTFTWSLAVEEHFYLILPIILWVLTRSRDRLHLIPRLTLGICVAALASRTLTFMVAESSDPFSFVGPTHHRLDALMFGVLIGYLYHFRRPVFERIGRYRVSIIAASLVLLTTTSPWIPVSAYASTLGFSATYLAFGGILVATLSTDWSRFPTGLARAAHPVTVGLRFLGVYSYTIYLTHVPLYYSLPMNDVVDRWPVAESVRPQLAAALFLVLAIVSGVLLSHVIERPVLRWRERHFSGRGKTVGARTTQFEPATGCPA